MAQDKMMIDEISSTDLEIGKTYDIRSKRKGNFWGTLLELNDTSGKFRIASGKAIFMAQDDRVEGDTIDMKLSFCKFYPIKEYIPIPPSRWGKDHWTTFAYVGIRCVDHKGVLNKAHMRTKSDKHPDLEGEPQKMSGFLSNTEYPTRLKGYFEDETNPNNVVYDHDDWDCIEDMIAAGLLIHIECVQYELTEKGWRIDNLLRQYKASGKMYATYEMPE